MVPSRLAGLALPIAPALVIALALGACRGASPPSVTAEPLPSATASPPVPDAGPGQAPPAPRADLLSTGHLSERAVSVAAVAGCVVAKDAAGHEARLTGSRTDDFPDLSPDGEYVVFRRNGFQEHVPAQIFRVSVLGGDPELLVTEEGYDGPHLTGIPLVSPGGPEFSVDGARVFFSVQNGRLGALCAVDVATKKVSWILTAVDTELIRKGPYRGHFFAVRREQDTIDGPLHERCFVLHSVTGEKIRSVRCGGIDSPDASLADPVARRLLGM